MSELIGPPASHGTIESFAAGCLCEWCRVAHRISDSIRAKRTARFLSHVDRSAGSESCWPWTGGLTPDGYGHVGWKGWSQLAHRVAFDLLVGPIPDELQVDHRCRNRACQNPQHLQAVTSQLNNENRSPETGSSGLRNVYWSASRQRWCVQVKHHRRSYWGGAFADKSDAAAAAVRLRNELHTNNLADRT